MSYETEAALVAAIEQSHKDAMAMLDFAGDVRAYFNFMFSGEPGTEQDANAVDLTSVASHLRERIEAAVADWPELPQVLAVELGRQAIRSGDNPGLRNGLAGWHDLAWDVGRKARQAWEAAKAMEHAADVEAIRCHLRDQTPGVMDLDAITAGLGREAQATYEKLVEALREAKEASEVRAEAKHVKPTERQQTGKSRATINQRMSEILVSGEKPEALTWTARNWADYLGCAPSSVVTTEAWKTLAETQEAIKAERALKASGRRQ